MIDPELLADLRRLVNASKLPEWQRDLVEGVPTDLVKQISEDFRSYNPAPRSLTPPATVTVVGSGKVVTGTEGPQHRPIDTNATNSGWVEAKSIDSWRAPGVDICDQLMDQADAIDRAERIRQLAQTAAIRRAEAELAKQPEPKPEGKGTKK
jgi:hypothetical protein